MTNLLLFSVLYMLSGYLLCKACEEDHPGLTMILYAPLLFVLMSLLAVIAILYEPPEKL